MPTTTFNIPREIALPSSLRVKAAKSKDKPSRFRMTANTGVPMNLEGFAHPVIVNLATARYDKDRTPVIADHQVSQRVGHTTKQRIDKTGIFAEGEISSDSDIAKGIVTDSKRGFPFQVSIGASLGEGSHFIEEAETTIVNGKEFNGPLIVGENAVIRELSICVLGADSSTLLEIAAKHSANIRQISNKGTVSMSTDFQTDREIRAQEEERVARIKATAREYQDFTFHMEPETGCKDSISFMAHAIREGMTAEAYKLKVMEATMGNPKGPGINHGPNLDSPKVLEAAVASYVMGDARAAKHYDEHTMQAAQQCGITCLMDAARIIAQQNGGVQSWRNKNEILRAALRPTIRAAGFSTADLSTLLSNVAGKTLLEAYKSFNSIIPQIAKKLSANDFKTHTGVGLTGDIILKEVANDGELKHARLDDSSYTYQLATYGRIFTLDRRAIINDDLSALDDLPRMFARGYALAREEAFWTLVLANTGNFFSVAHANLISGGTSALSVSSLSSAVKAMLEQVDSESKPINVLPEILAVPPALKVTADGLYTSQTLYAGASGTSTDDSLPDGNPHQGKYTPGVSPWIGSVAGLTGSSDTQWYLFSNPQDVAAFGVAYLQGNENPTIENVEMPAEFLGSGFRAFVDFGICQVDYRGAVKSAGA